MSLACVLFSCKKGEEDDAGPDCENDHTTQVTYTNTGSVPLRIEVATSLTPQYEPVNPILTLDLAPGATVVKEIQADRYFNVWYRDCSTNCTQTTYNSKTYEQCGQYEEKHGL